MTHAAETVGTAARRLHGNAVVGVAAAVFTIAVGAANGGYFPTSWGWAGLALAWVAIVLLLLRDDLALSGLALLQVAAGSAFVGWVALSTLWSRDVPQTVREIERDVVYVAAALTFVLLARRYARALLAGLLVGIVAICAYSLATRLFPDRLGVFDPVAVYRLSAPVGYWNALGLFAATGTLLAVGVVAHGRTRGGRAMASAALVVLLPTQYFTFSRGAWLALAVGAVAFLVVERSRLRVLAGALVVAAPPAIAVLLASRSPALTRQGVELQAAAHAGHRLAALLLVLAAVGAALGYVFAVLSEVVRPAPWVERAAAATVAVVLVLALGVSVAAHGSPVRWPQRAWDAFSAEPVQTGNLNKRLFSLSGSGRVMQWRVAADQARDYPLLGSGAGSFERYWDRHRPVGSKIRDVHNLYLEVLAELGPLGLALLVAFLGAPLLALRRARRSRHAAAAAGAYVAYLVHAAVDWDWEMLALTLPALLLGAVLLTRDRPAQPLGQPLRIAALGAAAVVVVVSFVGLVGNVESARATTALQEGDWAKAATHARRAHTWQPWSPDPYRLLGEAERAQGQFAAARAALRTAIAKDARDWQSWLDLARTTTGAQQRAALRRVAALDPLSPELAEFRHELHQGWALLDEVRA